MATETINVKLALKVLEQMDQDFQALELRLQNSGLSDSNKVRLKAAASEKRRYVAELQAHYQTVLLIQEAKADD